MAEEDGLLSEPTGRIWCCCWDQRPVPALSPLNFLVDTGATRSLEHRALKTSIKNDIPNLKEF